MASEYATDAWAQIISEIHAQLRLVALVMLIIGFAIIVLVRRDDSSKVRISTIVLLIIFFGGALLLTVGFPRPQTELPPTASQATPTVEAQRPTEVPPKVSTGKVEAKPAELPPASPRSKRSMDAPPEAEQEFAPPSRPEVPVSPPKSSNKWDGFQFVDFDGPQLSTRKEELLRKFPSGKWSKSKNGMYFIYRDGSVYKHMAVINYFFNNGQSGGDAYPSEISITIGESSAKKCKNIYDKLYNELVAAYEMPLIRDEGSIFFSDNEGRQIDIIEDASGNNSGACYVILKAS